MTTTLSRSLKRWEHFESDANSGVRGFGASCEEAFEMAGMALTAVSSDPDSVRPIECVELNCSAKSREALLVVWLNTLVFEMETRKMLFSRFELILTESLQGLRLFAKAYGERIDPARHQSAICVKAAVESNLAVTADEGAWLAQCSVHL